MKERRLDQIRLTCYYCDERVTLDFGQVRDLDVFQRSLRDYGWIVGAVPVARDHMLYDPICHDCGRGVVKNMLAAGGGKISDEARESLSAVYPDLFGN